MVLLARMTWDSLVIWNSGATRPRSFTMPSGWKSGAKKLNTLGARNGPWPMSRSRSQMW